MYISSSLYDTECTVSYSTYELHTQMIPTVHCTYGTYSTTFDNLSFLTSNLDECVNMYFNEQFLVFKNENKIKVNVI